MLPCQDDIFSLGATLLHMAARYPEDDPQYLLIKELSAGAAGRKVVKTKDSQPGDNLRVKPAALPDELEVDLYTWAQASATHLGFYSHVRPQSVFLLS
jgi:hypothetical protein